MPEIPTPGQTSYEARQDWLAYDNHCCAHCGQVPQQHHRDTRCYTAAEIGTRLMVCCTCGIASMAM